MNTENLETISGTLAENASFTDAVNAEKAKLEAEECEAEQATLFAGMVEAAYLMAMADGEITQEETDTIADGLYKLTDISEGALGTLLGVAISRHENEGQAARIAALGDAIPDPDHRRGAFLVASAVSWKGGGIGVKQGLALQALARAFDIPMNEMHKILAKAHG